MHDNKPHDEKSITISAFYRSMLRIRQFEEMVAYLIDAGEVHTPCHLCIGQEAIPVGVCHALKVEDQVWGAHRSHGHYLAKGGDMRKLMAEIFCRSTGCSKGRGGSMHIVAPEEGVMGTVPIVAATIPLAVGSALASSLRSSASTSVTFFGDGATEEGHFHESMNLAAVYQLPIVFVCENNFYSSHLSLLERRAKDNIHRAGEMHGICSETVDGNDVFAVVEAASRATERARQGDGPTLLECRTFRWRGHVGPSWDLDVGVKRNDELKDWLKKDPLELCAKRLGEAGQADLDQIHQEVENEVSEAVSFARRSPVPSELRMNDHVFS